MTYKISSAWQLFFLSLSHRSRSLEWAMVLSPQTAQNGGFGWVRHRDEFVLSNGCLFRCPYRSARSAPERRSRSRNFFGSRVPAPIKATPLCQIGVKSRLPKKLRDRPERPGADRPVRLGHQNKHSLLKTSTFSLPSHPKPPFSTILGGQKEVFTPTPHSVLTPHPRRGRYSHQPIGDRTCTGRLTRPPSGSGQTK